MKNLTGWKDKNGKNIYIGDRIKFVYDDRELNITDPEVLSWHNQRKGKEYIGEVCIHILFGEERIVVEVWEPDVSMLPITDVINGEIIL